VLGTEAGDRTAGADARDLEALARDRGQRQGRAHDLAAAFAL